MSSNKLKQTILGWQKTAIDARHDEHNLIVLELLRRPRLVVLSFPFPFSRRLKSFQVLAFVQIDRSLGPIIADFG